MNAPNVVSCISKMRSVVTGNETHFCVFTVWEKLSRVFGNQRYFNKLSGGQLVKIPVRAMDAEKPSNADLVKSVRDLTISRRGGVRTRGGRLPPISLREISRVSSSKKTVVPNIPQRRRKIKEEAETLMKKDYRNEPKDYRQNSGDRGARTRRPKVVLQTDGSFLAEGPAARTKKDRVDYESVSFSRASRAAASQERRIDPDTIKYLLESCEDEELEDVYNEMPPFRFPLLKEKTVFEIPKIKIEPVDYDIKQEPVDYGNIKQEAVDIKKEIKTEIEDDEPSCPVKKVSLKLEQDSKQYVTKNPAEEFLTLTGDGATILMQFPRHSFSKEAGTSEKSSNDVTLDTGNECEQASTILQKLDEGRIGKLQFLKSGRMKLILGSVAEYELLDASPSQSYWEAASIRMSEDAGGGDLVLLDKIRKTMLAIPWETPDIAADKLDDAKK